LAVMTLSSTVCDLLLASIRDCKSGDLLLGKVREEEV